VFATNPDQVDHHAWGFNLNDFWTPQQSPLLLSLRGVADIARLDVDHAPLVRHTPSVHLGSANESCVFPVYHQATLCLTDIDALRDRASFNSFTLWWLHPHLFPWWSPDVVLTLAVVVLGLFLGSGAALVRLSREPRPTPRLTAPRTARRAALSRAVFDGQRRGRQPVAGAGSAQRPHAPGRTTMRARSSAVTLAVARGAERARGAHDDVSADAGLGPLAVAALGGLLVYSGLATVGALSASRPVAPLVRVVTVGQTVVDGDIAYRVLGIARPRTVVDTRYPAADEVCATAGGGDGSCAYTVVRVWLRNLSSRRQRGIARANFMLADTAGSTTYPWPCWVPVTRDGRGKSARLPAEQDTRDTQRTAIQQPSCPLLHTPTFVDPAVALAALYHLAPAWYPIPPRVAVQRVLVYVVPTTRRRVILLGPGITLTRLDVPR